MNKIQVSFWSTIFLPPGVPLAHVNATQRRLFVHTRGNRAPNNHVLSLSDTNMREAGHLGSAIDVTDVAWFVQPVTPVGDLEQLAQAHTPFDDAKDLATILGHGVLAWDFVQTLIDVGPLWIEKAKQSIGIPAHATFAMTINFGLECPSLQREHALRVCIQGSMAAHLGSF